MFLAQISSCHISKFSFFPNHICIVSPIFSLIFLPNPVNYQMVASYACNYQVANRQLCSFACMVHEMLVFVGREPTLSANNTVKIPDRVTDICDAVAIKHCLLIFAIDPIIRKYSLIVG